MSSGVGRWMTSWSCTTTKLNLCWFDLVKGAMCHKIATWELAVMIFSSQVMLKNLGVYSDTTLSTGKHIYHISRSTYLEISRISSNHQFYTAKTTAQLMCYFVHSQLDYCNSVLIDIKPRRIVFLSLANTDMNTLDHCSKHFTVCQSKKWTVSK